MKSLYVKQGDKSKIIYILLGFLAILFIFFSITLSKWTWKLPFEMMVYFAVHGVIISYIFYYSKKWKTDTFLWTKENSVVLWDIIKFSLIIPFKLIKVIWMKWKDVYLGLFISKKNKNKTNIVKTNTN